MRRATHLSFLKNVLVVDVLEDEPCARLLHLTGHDKLVENVEGLVEAIDDVQLAHALVIAVQSQNILVNGLQHDQLVGVLVHTEDKVQTLVPSRAYEPTALLKGANSPFVDERVVSPVYEVTETIWTTQNSTTSTAES